MLVVPLGICVARMDYPKVAFKSPPITSPKYNAIYSVAYDRTAGKGTIAIKFRTNTIVLLLLVLLIGLREWISAFAYV